MAEVLRGISRNYGIAARRSGDEFVMFLYGFDSEDAVEETMRLFYKLLKGARIFLPNGEETVVSASAGVAYWQEGMSFEMLMNRADCALYQAKRGGRRQSRQRPCTVKNPKKGLAIFRGFRYSKERTCDWRISGVHHREHVYRVTDRLGTDFSYVSVQVFLYSGRE